LFCSFCCLVGGYWHCDIFIIFKTKKETFSETNKKIKYWHVCDSFRSSFQFFLIFFSSVILSYIHRTTFLALISDNLQEKRDPYHRAADLARTQGIKTRNR
jgi:hypothetical protein